jgi:hypothetical protein
MPRTLEEVRQDVMALPERDRQLLADEIIEARWAPEWRKEWAAEAERRNLRLENGDDRELTIDEFFADDAD